MKGIILVTEADKLYDIVRRKKRIDAIEASKEVGLDLKQVIEIAEILEDKGMITIHYPPVGEPVFIFGSDDFSSKKRKVPKTPGKIKLIGIVIAIAFLVLSVAYKNNPQMFNADISLDIATESYLDMETILIIATLLTISIIAIMFISLRIKKKRIMRAKVEKGRKDEKRRDKRNGRGKEERNRRNPIVSIIERIKSEEKRNKDSGRIQSRGRQSGGAHKDNKGRK